MAAEGQSTELIQVVALLAAGVVAVPLFKKIGLGSVLGYLTAGLIIGPYGLKLFTDPQSILHIAELGVVMFLFVIGLEMQPSRLWSLRAYIFGLGAAQVLFCGLLLTLVGMAAGFAPTVAFFAAMGFVLTSTAIVMQIMEERGITSTERGQRMISILLLEDLAIVPLLAMVALLSPGASTAGGGLHWQNIAIAGGSLAALVIAGRYLLNPFFRLLAEAHAREVLTAAALLVVLGSALAMQLGGLSMAMGAFLAGVLLSESTFRHQLEADVEPFRGILLGLFFLSVGMALDLSVMAAEWQIIALAVIAYMTVKAIGIYIVGRLFRASHQESLYRAALFAQGGEFAFVLYAAATSAGIFDDRINAILTATIIISMALTPIGLIILRRLVPLKVQQSMEGVSEATNLAGQILIIGFGRFGQVVSQSFLARGCDIAIIDTDTDMIRSAAEFGFKIYYGDGTRLDVLRASGAESARMLAICVDNRQTANKIVEIAKAEFPLAQTLVRSYDREHALELIQAGVDYQIRETFESAMKFGEEALRRLEVPEEELAEIMQRLRERDAERVSLEIAGGLMAGRAMIQGNAPRPTPFTLPTRTARPLSEETAAVAASKAEADNVSPP
jgi:glutathione-regulated potassium-efflux system protein KefB